MPTTSLLRRYHHSRIRSAGAALVAGASIVWACLIVEGPSVAAAHATTTARTTPPATTATPPENRYDLQAWLAYQKETGSASMPAVAQLFYRRGVETLRSGAAEDGVRMLRGACQLDPTFLAPRLALFSHFGFRDPSQALMELARIMDLAKSHFPLQHYLVVDFAFHATLVVFLATLAAALFVVWRRRETLRHGYEEFLSQFLSHRIAVASAWALFALPYLSGLGLALPTAFTLGGLWPSLRKSERVIFVALVAMLVAIPLGYSSMSQLAMPDHPERPPFYGTVDLATAPFSESRLEELRKLSGEHPDNGFLHFSTAWMAYRGRDYTLAKSEFEEAGHLWPNEPRVPNNLGNLAELSGQNDEAERLYHAAASLDPSWAMPHYNLGQLYTRQFRYAEASEELARATSFDFDMVRNLQAEAQLHPGDPLPEAWGWPAPRTFWDAFLQQTPSQGDARVPPAWSAWFEIRGSIVLVLAIALTLAGLVLGAFMRARLPVRHCSNCEDAVCRRCAARRRDQVYCAGCSASLREATTPEFARLLLARRRRTLAKSRGRWQTMMAALLPGLGPVFVDRLGFAWACLLLAMAGVTAFLGPSSPFPYDPRIGPLASGQAHFGGLAVWIVATALSLVTYFAFRGTSFLREIEPEAAKRVAPRVPRAA